MLDSLSDFAFGHGKLRAFFVVGAFASIAAFLLFLLLAAPFIWAGLIPIGKALAGAIGCGIGTGMVNSIFAAMSA